MLPNTCQATAVSDLFENFEKGEKFFLSTDSSWFIPATRDRFNPIFMDLLDGGGVVFTGIECGGVHKSPVWGDQERRLLAIDAVLHFALPTLASWNRERGEQTATDLQLLRRVVLDPRPELSRKIFLAGKRAEALHLETNERMQVSHPFDVYDATLSCRLLWRDHIRLHRVIAVCLDAHHAPGEDRGESRAWIQSRAVFYLCGRHMRLGSM